MYNPEYANIKGQLIILAITALVIFIFLIYPLTVHLTVHRQPDYHDFSNLNEIVKATQLYSIGYGGYNYYPPSLVALRDAGRIYEPQAFLCPNGIHAPRNGEELATDFETIMDLVGFCLTEEDTPGDTPCVWSKKGVFKNKRIVAHFNGHSEVISEKDFEKRMKDTILPFVEAQKKKAEEEKPLTRLR